MNLDDLWVGEKILVKSASEVGTFEKKVNKTTAIIKFEIGTSEIHTDDMELAGDLPIGPVKNNVEKQHFNKPEKNIEIEEQQSGFKVLDKANFENEIDLHFEKLAPNKRKTDVSNVLDFQLKACKEFIEAAIEYNESDIKIIHGKGNGILRDAVMDLLSEYRDNIYWDFPNENKGGAISLLLK